MRRSNVGGLVGVTVAFLVIVFLVQRSKDVHTRTIDSLTTANAQLLARNDTLTGEANHIRVALVGMTHERDSVKAVSARSTTRILAARTTLPDSATVSETVPRETYLSALHQLDAAIAELARKDAIIRKDSLEVAQVRRLVQNAEDQKANLVVVVQQTQQIARESYSVGVHTGIKRGFVLGVLSTFGLGLLVHAVIP